MASAISWTPVSRNATLYDTERADRLPWVHRLRRVTLHKRFESNERLDNGELHGVIGALARHAAGAMHLN